MKTLKDIMPGNFGVVKYIDGEGPVRRRLIDMGITPDTTIKVVKIAPFGDPMEVNLRGYKLSLRKEDAKKIILQETD